MPVYEDEIGFIQWRENMRTATQTARRNATPELVGNIKSLMRDFPWLQPGTAYGMAKSGVTGEKAWKVAAYDLYYQANETDRFGTKQAIASPQEQLLAWEKELRQQIRQEKQRQKLDEKAGSAFGDASQVDQNEARVARFGNMDLSEIKQMRRTVRGALATNDPVTMSAVLRQIDARSATPSPYDIAQQGNPVAGALSAGFDAAKFVLGESQRTARGGVGTPATGPVLGATAPGANVNLTQDAGAAVKGAVRGAAVAANMGPEALAAAERGVVGFGQDVATALGVDNLGPQGFKQDTGITSGQTGITAAGPGQASPYTSDPNGLTGLSPLAILEQTQGGQALIDLVQGNPVDVGSGWLPSYDSQTAEAAAEASREYSPYLIGGHAWTIGRAIADAAGFEPDTTPFTILSGSVDALQAWQLDPANFALSTLADANRARKLFDANEAGNVVGRVNAIEDALAGVDDLAARLEPTLSQLPSDGAQQFVGASGSRWFVAREGDDVRYFVETARRDFSGREFRVGDDLVSIDHAADSSPEAFVADVLGPTPEVDHAAARSQTLRNAGVGVGRRPFLRSKNPVDWLYGQGTPVVKAIAKESDPWTIYWAMDGRIPIKSDTGQNVLESLARAQDEGEVRRVLAGELGTSLDRVPKWRQGIAGKPPPRLLSDMPGRIVDPDDVDGTAHTLVNYLRLSKVPVEDQRAIFNQWVMAEGRGDRYAAIDAAYDAVGAQLRAAGATEDEITEVLRRSKNEWDRASVYGVEADTGEDMPLMLLDENGELTEVAGPRWEKERWNSTIVLPDPEEIRRLVASPAWKGLVNSSPWGVAMSLADGYMDLWKFVVLIRGAWPVRVIGDEMLRMSAVGKSPFVHPISYIAQTAGNPNDSKVFSWLERLGRKPTEEAVTQILDDRAVRFNSLLDDGMDAAEARKVVDSEMPIPKNFGKRWAEAGRKFKTKGATNAVDIGGAPFDVNDLYGEALTSRIIGQNQVSRRVYLGHFDVADRASEQWARGLVEEAYRIFSDTVTRRALRMNTDDFLEGLWSEDWGRRARQQMAAGRDAGDPWLRVLHDRGASDQYGRSVLDQLQNFHRGDQRIIDALVSGNWKATDEFGASTTIPLTYGGHPSDEAIDYAKTLQTEGAGPDNLKVQRAYRKTLGRRDADLAARDAFVNGAFDYLMTKPSNYLTRSVTFRDKYWEEAERLIPSMDRQSQAVLRKTVEKAKLPRDRKAAILARLDDSAAGEVTFEQADNILKRRALDHTRGLLYDLHKRSQFFDAARLVFPFGEAWKEVLTTWGRIIKDNPNTLRRTQQIIQGAREAEFDPVTGLPTGQGEGFFRHDPQTGQEVFTYPLSGWLSQQSVNVPLLGKIGPDMPIPIPLKGPTQSLNMVLSGLPGLGPVIQVPASEIVPDSPGWDRVRSVLFPFGEPEGDGVWDKFINSLKSNWGRQVERAQADPREDRMKGNMVFDVMAVLASTGEYDFANDEDAVYELNRLYRDAKDKAQDFQWIRALGAFTLPASPGVDFYAEDKTGNLVLLQQIRDEWNAKRDEFYEKGVPNASQQAFRWFLDTYGTDNIFATQSKTNLNVVGLEPTKEMRLYERDNPDVVTNFPNTWGLFAPQGGEFDYDAYISQIDAGHRDPLQPMEMARAAINRRADQVYSKYRKMVPDVPSREQSAWLADIRRQISAQFPGSTPGAFGGNEDTAAAISELRLAAQDPKLAKTELGEALQVWFDARDRADAAALANPKGRSSSATSSKETEALRAWLYGVADELAAEYDGFANAWDQVLSREFNGD